MSRTCGVLRSQACAASIIDRRRAFRLGQNPHGMTGPGMAWHT